MMLALFWPSGRWASRSVRLRAAMRTSTAFSFSAAVITTWTERVTATVIGSKMRPRLDLALEDRDALAGLLDRRELVEEEVVAALRDPGDRFRVAGPHPERRVGLLSRRRLHDHVVELPVLAAMGPGRIRRPRLHDHLERFLEAPVALLHRNAEAGELVVAISLADPEIETPVREQVDGGRLLGQQHGIVPGQHDHRRAQPQRGGARAHPRQQVQRGRHLAEPGEVVLDEKGADEAERLRLDVELDE